MSEPCATAGDAAPGVDHTITRRVAAGDEGAFAAFYEAWFAPTLALARACSRRDEPFCLDVVQDVMLRAARRLPALDSAAALRAWMAKAVGNAVTDRVRNEQRRNRRERDAAAGREARHEPWQQLAERERLAWLDESLRALPATDRALLEARFGGAENVTAAARALGLTADAAHGRLRRVLERMRRSAMEWWNGTT